MDNVIEKECFKEKMKIKQLETFLKDNDFDSSSYTLDGYQEDRYCIRKEGLKWHIFFFERGKRISEKSFFIEDDACKHFLELISKDSTTKIIK